MAQALPAVMLLDLDDTIVSFSAGPRNFWREAYQAHQQRFGAIGEAVFVLAVEEFAHWYWSDLERARRGRLDLYGSRREVVQGAFEKLLLDDRLLRDDVADFFTREKERAVAPFPGAIDSLRILKQRSVRLALVSNGGSEFQRDKLRRYELTPFFDAVLIEGEFGVGKPDPAIFREALARMKVSAAEAWMVGDNLHADVAGGQEAGLFAVWNDHAGAGLQPGSPVEPDRIVRHISELLT